MQESDEVTILQEGNVKITNIRTIIGSKTYQLSNIDSVRMHERESKLLHRYFLCC